VSDLPNDPIARVAQQWARPNLRQILARDIMHEVANWIPRIGLLVTPGESTATEYSWVADSQHPAFTRDINRAVAEWLRGVADTLDPEGATVLNAEDSDRLRRNLENVCSSEEAERRKGLARERLAKATAGLKIRDYEGDPRTCVDDDEARRLQSLPEKTRTE